MGEALGKAGWVGRDLCANPGEEVSERVSLGMASGKRWKSLDNILRQHGVTADF